MTKIVISGRPVPCVRMTSRGKFVKQNAQRYLDYKQTIGWAYKGQKGTCFKNKVEIGVTVYLYGKETEYGRDGDVDNYLKSAMDGLNKIAYADDRQVVKATVEKLSCDRKGERMEIKIKEVS